MRYDSPKPPKKNWSYGISYILKPLPKFAVKLGAAFMAVAATGFTYTTISDAHPEWAQYMGYCGLAGIFLTTLFGKK